MAKKPATQRDGSETEGLQLALPIEWHDDPARVVFANNMLVQIDDHECHLSFFEIKPPLVMGTREEKERQVEKMKSIPARCVVRVVISRNRLKTFAEALQRVTGVSDAIDERGSNGKSK